MSSTISSPIAALLRDAPRTIISRALLAAIRLTKSHAYITVTAHFTGGAGLRAAPAPAAEEAVPYHWPMIGLSPAHRLVHLSIHIMRFITEKTAMTHDKSSIKSNLALFRFTDHLHLSRCSSLAQAFSLRGRPQCGQYIQPPDPSGGFSMFSCRRHPRKPSTLYCPHTRHGSHAARSICLPILPSPHAVLAWAAFVHIGFPSLSLGAPARTQLSHSSSKALTSGVRGQFRIPRFCCTVSSRSSSSRV